MMSLTVLTRDEVESIHRATLRLLAETGVVLTEPRAREILLEAGAEAEGDMVRLPRDLVEEVVGRCPEQVRIRGRSGQEATLGDGQTRWHNVGGAREVLDPPTGESRPASLQDVRDSTRVLDGLEHVTTISPFFTPQDVPGHAMSLAMYRHSLPFTTKPLQGPGVHTPAEVACAVEMASVIGEPGEVLTLSVSAVSPLSLPDNVAGAILSVAEAGIPFAPLPCPTAGTTAPFSMAGALAQQNAEVLASIVLAELVHPELPVVYCGRLSMMEPRTGASVWSGVETGLVSAATVQIGHRYGLPVNVYGFTTNSNAMDLQSGHERALNAAIPALAGADELSGVGEMGAGVMGSYAQMVYDDEIIATIQRLRRGFAVDEDALGVDLIARAMGSARNFLAEEHTVRYLRSGELLTTELAERRPWKVWIDEGRGGAAERAQAKAERLLEEHEVPPLSETQEQELDRILEAFAG